MKKIRVTGPIARTIRSTTVKARTIDPADVARALGAEIVAGPISGSSKSHHIAALRQRLFGALKSSGGRPGIEGTDRRQKIPMSDADWKSLESIAAALSSDDVALAPGQVASQLLHDAIETCVREGVRARATPTPKVQGVAEPKGSTYRRSRRGR